MPSSELLASFESKDKSLTGHMVLDLLLESMNAVENVSELNGPQKKIVALNLIEEKLTLPNILKVMIPFLIDLLIMIDRGQIKFNKKKASNLLYNICCGTRKD